MLPLTIEFAVLATTCASAISPQTLAAIVNTESGFNPYAIGVVNGYLERQPTSLQEAITTANALDQGNWNWSAGLGQINKHNFKQYGLTTETVFDPCLNLTTSSKILTDCYLRATKTHSSSQALFSAFSCYYSGNFKTGYKSEGGISYVEKIARSANITPKEISFDKPIKLQNDIDDTEYNIPIVPSIDFAIENLASTKPIKVIPINKKKPTPPQQQRPNKQKMSISSVLTKSNSNKSTATVF